MQKRFRLSWRVIGIFRLQNATTSVRNTATETSPILVTPNPLRGNGHITYHPSQLLHLRISLIKALGQTVAILHDATQSAGEHSFVLDTS
ncbi:MAG: hypothetical protein H9535_20410 [Ignavibacteria bacterium]|nr:hypothetical protein [Ignavibacteria bacterium]